MARDDEKVDPGGHAHVSKATPYPEVRVIDEGVIRAERGKG